jgi:hypothetical protein
MLEALSTGVPSRARSTCAKLARCAAVALGTRSARDRGMAKSSHTLPGFEVWTVFLHTVVWTAITVGVIMVFVVVMMH